jgi:hypothetical protein
MLKKVGNRMGCDIEATDVAYRDSKSLRGVDWTVWWVEGCGDQPFLVSWTKKTEFGVWGFVEDSDVRRKAAFDLDCPADQLEYTFIDPLTRGVSGCGRRVSYSKVRDGWFANVASE